MVRLRTGELEGRVMEVLWDHDPWLTPREVHATLNHERSLAYTTVMTVLVRLWQKGRLDRQRQGRAFAYRPRQSREEHAADRMGQVLVGARDRHSALAHFVETLSPSDRDQLRRMLRGRPGAD